jgi:hypothetical protein
MQAARTERDNVLRLEEALRDVRSATSRFSRAFLVFELPNPSHLTQPKMLDKHMLAEALRKKV